VLVDLLHLLRTLRRSPSSAVAAVLTLSLTLGAGASIFAVVDAVVLAPPPFADPEALVTAGEVPIADATGAPRAVGYATYLVWRERAASLAAIEAYDGTNLTLTDLGAAERVSATNVTPGFLPLLGVAPALGRSFDAADNARPLVVVSHAFWRGKLGADPNAIGRQLVLGGRAHTVIGVLPERFYFALSTCDLWRPFPVTADEAVRSGYRVRVVARLNSRLAPADLAGALTDVSRTSSPPSRAVTTPIATTIAGGATGVLAILAGAAALAVLIAFTNLAGLLVVRSIDRRRELAVRSALGATRAAIARQVLLEAAALVAIGTAGGVLLAAWMTPLVGRLALQQFGGIATREVAVSWRVVGAVSIAAFACALICGMLPAVMAARGSVADVLRGGATPAPRERNLRRLFVCGEVALAFVLLVSMTLVGRSLLDVLNVNPGFDAHGVMTLQLSLPGSSYSSAQRVTSFYSTLQAALEERLGPGAVSFVDEIPLTGDRARTVVRTRPADAGREAVVRASGSGYFETMRIPVVAGRSFDRSDTASAPMRAVLSESLATSLFAREQPVGRQLWLAPTAPPAEIVGVVGEVKQRALDDAASPTVYLSASQSPSNSNILVVRSARPDADVIATVREEVARLDRNLPVYGVRAMEDVVAASPGVPARRVLTAAFSGFAALAVVLGALGLFGAAAHDVARRRVELALRIALGADPRRILIATVGQSVAIVGSGLLVGSLLSIWAARALSSVLLATGSLDVVSVALPAAVLLIAGVGAVLPVARRAARIDPLSALRAE
jgi:putative ABC transport system permease protein